MALLATGCAEEGGASREHAAASRSQAEPRGAAAGTCRKILASFLGSMDALRRKLTVGLTYGQYLGELRTVRVAYRGIPADRLRLGCLLAAGTPGERALNRYTEAANAWGDCLAAPSCDVEAVEPRLQRLWARAAGLLSAARSGA